MHDKTPSHTFTATDIDRLAIPKQYVDARGLRDMLDWKSKGTFHYAASFRRAMRMTAMLVSLPWVGARVFLIFSSTFSSSVLN